MGGAARAQPAAPPLASLGHSERFGINVLWAGPGDSEHWPAPVGGPSHDPQPRRGGYGIRALSFTVVGYFWLFDLGLNVIDAARRYLQPRGVDLIVCSQCHAACAFAADGFLRGLSNFFVATSKQLATLAMPAAEVHMNRGDGDGRPHL